MIINQINENIIIISNVNLQILTVSHILRMPGEVLKNSMCMQVQHLQKQHWIPPAPWVSLDAILIIGPAFLFIFFLFVKFVLGPFSIINLLTFKPNQLTVTVNLNNFKYTADSIYDYYFLIIKNFFQPIIISAKSWRLFYN